VVGKTSLCRPARAPRLAELGYRTLVDERRSSATHWGCVRLERGAFRDKPGRAVGGCRTPLDHEVNPERDSKSIGRKSGPYISGMLRIRCERNRGEEMAIFPGMEE